MKTVKQKAKTKKNTPRFGRVKFSNKDSSNTTGPDLSQLRKPIDISVSSLIQVTKLLETGGDEVQSVLAYECDVIYECRICRSLFRSLANFISHKRVYCTEKFNVTLCKKTRKDHTISEATFVEDPRSIGDIGTQEHDNSMRILRSQATRSLPKKDLTSVIHMLQEKRNDDIDESDDISLSANNEIRKTRLKSLHAPTRAHSASEKDRVPQQIVLEPINTSKTAVYQTATQPTSSSLTSEHNRITADLMKAQIMELQEMIGKKTAILNPEGSSVITNQIEKNNDGSQINGSEDDEASVPNTQDSRNLVCSVCNAKFATRKTLTFHMKSLHLAYRTWYPCPCCTSAFVNPWSVYRHLCKVHRKSNEQVRRLRAQIQEKAFRKETTGAEDIEKENALIKSSGTGNQQTGNDAQDWMETFELDLDFQRCGGCGRRFDRKAALSSHSQICQKRIAACNELAAANKAKKLPKTPSSESISDVDNASLKETMEKLAIRSQSHKKQLSRLNDKRITMGSARASFTETPAEVTDTNETSIRVENVSRISDADWEMMDTNTDKIPMSRISALPNLDSLATDVNTITPAENISLLTTIPDSPEIIFTSIDEARTVAVSFGTKKRKVSLINNSKDSHAGIGQSSVSAESLNSVGSLSNNGNEIKIDHITVMENRIATIANLRKLQCLPCHRKFTSMTNLRRHMAIHIGWNRYRCRLCDFKCFAKCDCVAHCNKMHDAKNTRAIIADMVVQIPPDQDALSKEIVMDIPNSYDVNSDLEVIEVTDPSPILVDVTESSSSFNDTTTPLDTSKELNNASDDKSSPDGKQLEEKFDDEGKSHESRSRLDTDPDLRKMVMEVIFGTSEVDSKSAAKSESRNPSPSESGSCHSTASSPAKSNESQESISSNNDSLGQSDVSASKLEESRPQRPTRNRVKPVNEDFIYDLKEVIRKESAINRAAAIAAQKVWKKKQLNQVQQVQQAHQSAADNEYSGESKLETEVPELQKLSTACKLSSSACEGKGESNSYTTKFSLRQAEVKLHSLNESATNEIMKSTKISVSSQK
ncbi:uncharacterized protein LOC105686520 [Athalia rosae]|uniref:uncharacterized protein LOC105686520 n=1 Tax=Athalia rosae TaxID=37344 RepID=UPI002034679B|nr:uncharacterized protein LOC105686520 [Athalia rosae]XP_048513942.1 uncharacterized protein LOC105686520 [Athalia rosae]